MKNWILRYLFPAHVFELERANARIEDYKAELKQQHDAASAEHRRISVDHDKALRELEGKWDKLEAEHRRDATIAAIATRRIDELERRRNVAWPRPAKRIPRPQILAAFAEPIDQGLGAALHQEIDDYLQDLLDQVSQPPSGTMPEALRLHLAGGIEHLRLLQKSLLDLHAEAGRRDAELEEKETGE